MFRFRPFPGMLLHIGSANFAFMPHPMLPQDKQAVFVLEGGEALIYQMRHVESEDLYALKVFKPAFRGAHIARINDFLMRQSDLPGLALNYRGCFTKGSHPELIRAFPELEYAIVMPWLVNLTWAGLILNRKASAAYSFNEARDLALATATVLWNIESHKLTHTDIAGGNVMLAPDRKQIRLIDIENMYVPFMPPPTKCSQGSPGYQHRHLGRRGQWCPEGDRFAGAVLLAEMLTWWEPRVRAYAHDRAESLFCSEELQVVGTPCWQAVRDVLHSISPNLLALFDQAWTSTSLTECPDLSTWAIALLSAFS